MLMSIKNSILFNIHLADLHLFKINLSIDDPLTIFSYYNYPGQIIFTLLIDYLTWTDLNSRHTVNKTEWNRFNALIRLQLNLNRQQQLINTTSNLDHRDASKFWDKFWINIFPHRNRTVKYTQLPTRKLSSQDTSWSHFQNPWFFFDDIFWHETKLNIHQTLAASAPPLDAENSDCSIHFPKHSIRLSIR